MSNKINSVRSNHQNRANTSFNIAYTNIRGLRSKFHQVESFLSNRNSPDMFCLCETNLDPSFPDTDFNIPGYSTLITKHDTLGRHMHGLGVYIKQGIPCARDKTYEDPSLSFMCFRMALLHSTSFIIFLYRPCQGGSVIFDNISGKIDEILSDYPSANIHICGDFNVHHKDWLTHSRVTDPEGIECFNFSVAHDLTQIVSTPTRLPDVDTHFASLLDLFLTSCPEVCATSILPPLGSDHCVVSVTVNIPPKMTQEIPFHLTVYRYSDADWDSFRTFVADTPRSFIFNNHPTKVASLVSERISEGIDLFIPHKKYQQKPASQPWFTPGCAAAIVHRNHYFRRYNNHRNPETKADFRQSSNRCSRILKQAKESYKSSVKTRIEEETLGSKVFRNITNKILNQWEIFHTHLN